MIKICEFISDHAVIKCAIDFPSSLANCQTTISYRRYHRINMSDFRSDLKDMPFVKCPANSVSLLYDQYAHDLSRNPDRHAPLVSCLKTKQSADWLSETYRQRPTVNLNVLGEKIKVNTTGDVFGVKLPGVIILPIGTRLSITGNLSLTAAMIPRNYGRSYTKSYIDPTTLLCLLVNPQSHWLTRCSQSVANFLNVPKFQPKIHKSTKQFIFSFAFDIPTVWNSLLEDTRASPTIASFRKKLKTYLYAKAYPP